MRGVRLPPVKPVIGAELVTVGGEAVIVGFGD